MSPRVNTRAEQIAEVVWENIHEFPVRGEFCIGHHTVYGQCICQMHTGFKSWRNQGMLDNPAISRIVATHSTP
jgi:hypothetical protein